jgi:hypothetical protein
MVKAKFSKNGESKIDFHLLVGCTGKEDAKKMKIKLDYPQVHDGRVAVTCQSHLHMWL